MTFCTFCSCTSLLQRTAVPVSTEEEEGAGTVRLAGQAALHGGYDNKSVQGKGGTVLQIQEEVLLEHKLTVLAKEGQRGTLLYFPSLREFKEV